MTLMTAGVAQEAIAHRRRRGNAKNGSTIIARISSGIVRVVKADAVRFAESTLEADVAALHRAKLAAPSPEDRSRTLYKEVRPRQNTSLLRYHGNAPMSNRTARFPRRSRVVEQVVHPTALIPLLPFLPLLREIDKRGGDGHR